LQGSGPQFNLATLDEIHFITAAAFVKNGAVALITARLKQGRQFIKLRPGKSA
jgi:hypothetical protein